MRDIRLSDGSLLEVKINFLTMKLIIDNDIEKLSQKQQKKPDDKKLIVALASKMIYVILRSNGMRIDEEEACILVPMDDETIEILFNEFSEKMQKFKKKQENKL